MAITKTNTQVTWAAANTIVVTANSAQTSDVMTPDATCFAATLMVKADNITATPAATDQVHVWLLASTGDPDAEADSQDEYTTVGHSLLLGVLDTYTGGNGEDPAIMIVDLPTSIKNFKLYAEGTTAASANNITVSAQFTEHRAA